MSTVSSQLLVSSSSLTEDFYKLFINKKASDTTLVTVGRIAVVAVGAVAAVDRARSRQRGAGARLERLGRVRRRLRTADDPVPDLAADDRARRGRRPRRRRGDGDRLDRRSAWNQSFLGGPGVYEIIPGFILSMAAIVVVSLATEAKGEFRPIAAE